MGTSSKSNQIGKEKKKKIPGCDRIPGGFICRGCGQKRTRMVVQVVACLPCVRKLVKGSNAGKKA